MRDKERGPPADKPRLQAPQQQQYNTSSSGSSSNTNSSNNTSSTTSSEMRGYSSLFKASPGAAAAVAAAAAPAAAAAAITPAATVSKGMQPPGEGALLGPLRRCLPPRGAQPWRLNPSSGSLLSTPLRGPPGGPSVLSFPYKNSRRVVLPSSPGFSGLGDTQLLAAEPSAQLCSRIISGSSNSSNSNSTSSNSSSSSSPSRSGIHRRLFGSLSAAAAEQACEQRGAPALTALSGAPLSTSQSRGGPLRGPPPPPRLQALLRLKRLVEAQQRGPPLPPAEEEAEYLLGPPEGPPSHNPFEGAPSDVLAGTGSAGPPTLERRGPAELLPRWREAVDDVVRFSGRMQPRELLEALRLMASAKRRDPQLLLAATQALLQQQHGVEALSAMQTVMLLRHLQTLEFFCLPLALRAFTHLDDTLTLAAQERMRQQQQQQEAGWDCCNETDFAVLAPYIPWQQPCGIPAAKAEAAAAAAARGPAAQHQQQQQQQVPFHRSSSAAVNELKEGLSCWEPAEDPAAAADTAKGDRSSALHAMGLCFLSSSLVSFAAAAKQLGPRTCQETARLGTLVEALTLCRASDFNAPQIVSLGLNCVALGRGSASLLHCLLSRTEALLPTFSFPLLTLQLNLLTRLLQLNSRLLLAQQHRDREDKPQQQQQQQQVDLRALGRLWCLIVSRLSSALPQDAAATAAAAASSITAKSKLRDLLHDHVLAAQEAYYASLLQQQQQQELGAPVLPLEGKDGTSSFLVAPGGASQGVLPDGLPAVKPHELKNVVNALNSFSRLADLGLVSLREVAAEPSAAVAAAAAAAAADQTAPVYSDARRNNSSSSSSKQQQYPLTCEAAAPLAAGDEMQRWQQSRARLSSVVECTGSTRMRGIELGPGDRRCSSSIYGFFHRAILLLVQQQQHLDPQSLSNAVNAFAKARLQGSKEESVFFLLSLPAGSHARHVSALIPRLIETAADFKWQHLSMTLNGFAWFEVSAAAQATTNIIHAMGSFGFKDREFTSFPPLQQQQQQQQMQQPQLLQRQQGIWQQLLQAACRRKDLKLEAMTMLKVSAMAVFGVYGVPATAAAATQQQQQPQHSSSSISNISSSISSKGRNAYNRLYDSNGNFLLHALQQQQRQLERHGGPQGGKPLGRRCMQLQGETVPAALVRQPQDVFLPYEQLDEGHKFLAALLTTQTLTFYPGRPSGLHLQVAQSLKGLGLSFKQEVIVDPYVIDLLLETSPTKQPSSQSSKHKRRPRGPSSPPPAAAAAGGKKSSWQRQT
ncbi:hypothetical protein ACSSS7_005690 [Eimeria intestinalis]